MISEFDKKIITKFAKKYNLSTVILFGSSLSSSDPKDIDIGIKGIKPGEFFNFYWDVYRQLTKPVDVINLNKKNSFNRLIEQHGQLLYGKAV